MDLQTRIAGARKQSDQVLELVRPDALYERPIPERHRIIFYLGHLEAFDWNLLQPRLTDVNAFDAGLDRLFAFGIDPVDGGLPSDQPGDWPSERQVRDYGQRVRSKLDAALESGIWGGDESRNVILNVAVEHRLMHVETLAYMLHQLPLERKARIEQTDVKESGEPNAAMVQVPAGRAKLGAECGEFGWDNEFLARVVDVPAFSIDRYKVTNGQYLEFVRAAGYGQRELWTDAGWRWKEREGIEHPVFWKREGELWFYRGMFEEIPLPETWPVYVSHAEASAYAAWVRKRLPTEAEWHRAAEGAQGGYLGLRRWDPTPVNAFPSGQSAFGVDGMLANGWEWTSSLFEPFPGFKAFPFYPGYSASFFSGMHYVMKGGSTRTEECMLRRSFRNWFQPHYQYVYAGFRCAVGQA
jgi:iron(II)-dependent oxidoreductase